MGGGWFGEDWEKVKGRHNEAGEDGGRKVGPWADRSREDGDGKGLA